LRTVNAAFKTAIPRDHHTFVGLNALAINLHDLDRTTTVSTGLKSGKLALRDARGSILV